MNSGKLIILVGVSGVGKTTIMKNLIEIFKDKLNFYPTYTTREKRNNEKNEIDYFFINKDEFQKLKDENFFIETINYNNNFYGTSYKFLENLNNGFNYIVILDLNGALEWKKKYKNTKIILIDCKNEFEIKNRINNRNYNEKKE